MKSQPAILALEDGTVFNGRALADLSSSTGEVVFNTSMTGYQEILSDPSYCGQLVALTTSHVGNVGTNQADNECDSVFAKGLIINQLAKLTSNWRNEETLVQYLERHQVPLIFDIDTRRLTRHLRTQGAMRGAIGTAVAAETLIEQAKNSPSITGADLAKVVSTQKTYTLGNENAPIHLAVYDYGVKQSILNECLKRNCKLTVFNAQATTDEVLSSNPNGIILSNGPGDPAACDYAIKNVQILLTKKIPLFGICLGFQILGIACGAKGIKMKFGHHGANHPVYDYKNKQVLVTAQNHGFAIDEKTLPNTLSVTHRSLFDNTVQGLSHRDTIALAFQGHPEAGPGPNDAKTCFDEFIKAILAPQEFLDKKNTVSELI